MPDISPSATQGTLHSIPPISAFEPTSVHPGPTNTILWIGGLFDTARSVTYPYTLSPLLPPSWSIAQLILSSSGTQWGTSSLGSDVTEISAAVTYFRSLRPNGKIVLMGHSTGTQDCIHYAVSPSESSPRPTINGIILQAPVSDREAMVSWMKPETLAHVNEVAQTYVSDGRGEDLLPRGLCPSVFKSCAVSARRWLSLASPDHKGEDDYFSSDLEDWQLQKTFGRVAELKVPLLVLYGGADETVPRTVDKKALVERWFKVMKDGNGVVDPNSAVLLEGASHNLNKSSEEVVQELCRRVIGFLDMVD